MDSQEGASHHHNIYQRKKYKLFQNFSLSASESHSSVSRGNPTYNKPFVNPINKVIETQYHHCGSKISLV